ncbi:hypothetical protein, partial [Ligilactobacillus agilis]
RRNDWRDRYMLVKDWVQDRVDYAVEQNTITMQEKFAQQLIVEAKENNEPFEKLAQRLENFFDADFADKMLAKYYQQA